MFRLGDILTSQFWNTPRQGGGHELVKIYVGKIQYIIRFGLDNGAGFAIQSSTLSGGVSIIASSALLKSDKSHY